MEQVLYALENVTQRHLFPLPVLGMADEVIKCMRENTGVSAMRLRELTNDSFYYFHKDDIEVVKITRQMAQEYRRISGATFATQTWVPTGEETREVIASFTYLGRRGFLETT